ncbi:unnamed protein product [Mytilus edulis]|uniref:Uncharacterized protein n=1 Tax=Mytilus edulis TaxID=6550 RepID=A0A8S3U6Z5_MYTED|nr:unnamed protein product [Mytilus edulis]
MWDDQIIARSDNIRKKEEVDQICLEIEQKIQQTTTGTGQIESIKDLSCSWEIIGMNQIPLSQEEQALLYLHRMLDSAIFKNDHIIVNKNDQRFAISIQLNDVNASEKMQLESDIKQVIANKRSELFSSEVKFTAEELVFLDKEHVYGDLLDNRLNLTSCNHYQRAYIRCAWYIGKCTCDDRRRTHTSDRNLLDLRRDVFCHEWKLSNGNFINIINPEDERWVCKQSAVFKIIVKDKTSSCECFIQPEGFAIKLYIPEWTANGKEKHTVFSS